MTKKVSKVPSLDELVLELCHVETPEDLTHWKQNREITGPLINAVTAEVRRLIDAANFDSARRLAQWCLLLAQESADPITKARALVSRGLALARVNDVAQALPYFDEALRLYEDAGEELDAARVRMNRVSCYSHLSRYHEAMRDAEIGKQTFIRLGDKRLLAMTYNNLGAVLFRLDRHHEWLAAVNQAETLLEEIGDRRSLAMVYSNHATVLADLNSAAEAFRYYRLSRELAQETGQVYLAACCNYNLGCLHFRQGQYTTALDILTETRKALPDERWHAPLCDLTQSEIYLEMNMYGEAIRLAEAAYTSFETTRKPFEMARALTVVAIARSYLREFAEAAKLFERARTMFEEQGNDVRAAVIDLHKGMMCLEFGRYSEARLNAEQACRAFLKEDLKHKEVFARIVSAKASLKLGDVETASHDARVATSMYEESPIPWVGHQLHVVRGEIYLAQHGLEQAREEFREAIEQSEQVRANIAADELRLNFLKDKAPVYELLLNTDLQLESDESFYEAFETAERAKSRTLVDLLAGSIDSLQHVAWSSVEDIQAALPSDAALIEYCMTSDQVTAFCLSPTRFSVIQNICSRDAAKKEFELLRFQLARLGTRRGKVQERDASSLASIQNHLLELYKMLVRPVETFIADRKSLVVVPFGFLHYLPFHALFDGSSYLTDRFGISYAPAATIYRLFRTKKNIEAGGAPLLIGVPDARTPFIPAEIESIRSVLPDAHAFIGPEATRDRMISEMTSASLIHIASHATFRPGNPMFSSIQLHDAPLNFFDIYTLRTSASLITLSGCGTGLSSVVAGDELLGLVRGFLYAGATSVLISLWDVNDRTTADLMKYFYGHLTHGEPKNQSLRSAMLQLRQEQPHPYYWAPFLLMGDSS